MANPAWSPNATIAPYAVIVDSNGNIQQAGGAGGITALNPPSVWGFNLGEVTQDNTVSWTCVAVLATPVPAIAGLPAATPPSFVSDADGLDVNAIVKDMIAEYEAIASRSLQPAQVERLFINFAAYRESLVRQAIQYAGEQNLLAFARYPMLDFLGALLGVTRLASQPATTIIQFVLANPLSVSLTIPAGTPVGSSDGQVVFLTDAALTIPPGQTTGNIGATCQTAGEAGNGYLAGQIDVMLAPNALIASAANTVESNGGSSPETDDHYRTRIQAAPSRFSNAGPAGAYRFFALDVDPSIVDVQVVSPNPGQVNVYILTGPVVQPAAAPNSAGIASSTLLAAVLAALSADAVRPLTDTVNVYAVTEVDYQIAATVTLYADADPTTVEAACNAAAALFALNNASRIGRDIVQSQLVEALSVPGVYEVQVTSPAGAVLSMNAAPGQWANCTAINLTFVIGSERS